jgi:UDP-N-acetylglucosamine--N-acetylmuramyl-(pentapeptide) pyrophosphoryl-undecaprenol N-acetylglucosamine transferase
LDAGRLQRKFTVWTIPSLLRIPFGFVKAFILLNRIKPDIVLSFGGFVGLPVALAAKLKNIPVIVHEQTAAAGRGNIVTAKFADKIAVSRPSSLIYFDRKKTVVTGNPIDPNIMKIGIKKDLEKIPVLFITGGHTGSLRINDNIQKIVKPLLNEFIVVHQTGKLDYDRFYALRKSLPEGLNDRYIVYGTIPPSDWPGALAKADIILSRAGANTVSQILVIKRPSILIPIPFSYLNEQFKNAKYAEEFGIAKVIEEKDLNANILIKSIKEIKNNWNKMVAETSGKMSPDENAAKNIYETIKNLL